MSRNNKGRGSTRRIHSQFGGRRQQPNAASNSIAAWFRQATAHHQRGELNSAVELYQRILAQNPNHADSLHLLGIIRGEQGKLDEAWLCRKVLNNIVK